MATLVEGGVLCALVSKASITDPAVVVEHVGMYINLRFMTRNLSKLAAMGANQGKLAGSPGFITQNWEELKLVPEDDTSPTYSR
jgi:hypothetical protein